MTASKASKRIAIITGASSGLGAEFAKQIEANYFLDEVWLVARRAEPMRELAERFQKAKGVIISADLTSVAGLNALKQKIAQADVEIEFLVNNAGYGKIGPFAELGLEEQLQMIDLNVRALTFLTHVALPHMKPGAKILQVASSIGFSPAPDFAVYAATKAYVVSLSEALNYEFKKRGIQVIAVCPGPVATEFFQVAQQNAYMKDKVPSAEPFNKMLMASAADVVRKALSDVTRGKSLSIFGLPIRLFVSAVPFMPRGMIFRALGNRK